MNTNPILNVDSYKTSHFQQYPPGAEIVSSYIESRGGESPHTVFFGLQMFVAQYLSEPITQAHIDEADAVLTAHGVPFNRAGWEHILNVHNGHLPIEIQAVPEGSVVPTSNVLVQVQNTDRRCAWLTSYVETALLRAVWYPTTVATRSYNCRRLIEQALLDTADSIAGLPFKLHDFGARGASSLETAAIGGAAHLLNFSGTDTLSGVLALRRYYAAQMPGFAIPAAEHSTITCWGREAEGEAYANMLTQFAGPDKTVAIVSDSYDLFGAIANLWGAKLRQQVIDNGGTVVIRPDSGDPVDIVWQTVNALMDHFGYSINSKGYRILPSYIRVIQGDGVSLEMIDRILRMLKLKRLSADNVAFGMGGELLQKVDRDTQKFAMKASAIRIKGRWRDVYKDPLTDPGKTSKRGRLQLIRQGQQWQTVRENQQNGRTGELQVIYRNGKLLQRTTFEAIRARLHPADPGSVAELAAEFAHA